MTRYSTETPKLFARFFSEVNYDALKEKVTLFESCHGQSEEINVLFFKEIPGECAKIIREDTSEFYGVSNYSLSDSGKVRQLLVRVK